MSTTQITPILKIVLSLFMILGLTAQPVMASPQQASSDARQATVASCDTEVVVDNADASGVTVTGDWRTSTSIAGYQGSNYFEDRNEDQGNKSVRFTPTLPETGEYMVYVRWTSHGNRADNAPINIVHNGGTDSQTIDQKQNGDRWNLMGTYSFNAGTAGSVEIRNDNANGHVIADAVRFVLLPEVIVDNADKAYGVTLTGEWMKSTIVNEYHGTNYIHDLNTDQGFKSARFTPQISATGTYSVFVQWTTHANRATNTPIRVVHSGGTSNFTVNQEINGGQWNALGAFTLSSTAGAGEGTGLFNYVEIHNTNANGYVIVDAVKFVNTSNPSDEIVIDNTEIAAIAMKGDWRVSTSQSGFHGANYFEDRNEAQGSKSVRFTPDLPFSGDYKVYIKWTNPHSNRASNASVVVNHADGTSPYTVDQDADGSNWLLLGTHPFLNRTSELILRSNHVEIRNDGANGHVLADAIKFVAASCGASGYIPSDITALSGSQVTIPVMLNADMSGTNTLSYEFDLTFNHNILTFDSISKAGTLSNDWDVTAHSPSNGQINVAGFGTTPLSGSGTLVNLVFNVVGANGTTSSLHFADFMFNEGTPQADMDSGAFSAGGTTLSIAGNVTYGSNNQLVSGIDVSATSSNTVQTDNSGLYGINVIAGEDHTITVAKTGDERNAITAFDAARVIQCVVGARPMTDCAVNVGDVTKDGNITALDAATIASHILGITSQSGHTGEWEFTPSSNSYTSISENQTDQNYTAYLLGDVTGNWNAGTDTSTGRSMSASASVQLQTGQTLSGQTINVPVRIQGASNTVAYQMTVNFDASALAFQGFSNGDITGQDWTVKAHETQSGRIEIVAYGVEAMQSTGTMVNLTFAVASDVAGQLPVLVDSVQLNEDQLSPQLVNRQIFLPIIQ